MLLAGILGSGCFFVTTFTSFFDSWVCLLCELRFWGVLGGDLFDTIAASDKELTGAIPGRDETSSAHYILDRLDCISTELVQLRGRTIDNLKL